MGVEEKNKEKETLHYAKLPYNHLKKKYEKGHIKKFMEISQNCRFTPYLSKPWNKS